MLQGPVIILTSFAYLGILFAIAYYADQRADAGRPVIANPYVYSLSLAVYATAWTFYGSVGRAASDGVGFLPIYIGPTLMIALWWLVMRKIIRISKQNRITSLADFIASRYGKSALLGGIVTIIAVIGILPYISLQLKAVSTSYSILVQYPEIVMPQALGEQSMRDDTALWVALILAAFTIAFGTRHLDAAEHHQGMVAAIAFESLVKLLAFLAVGVFVTFILYDGPGDLFARAAAQPKLRSMMTPLEGVAGGYASWVWLTVLSMLAGLGITSKLGRFWPGMPGSLELHRFTGLLGIGFGVVHALVLLGDKYMNYTLGQLLVPFMAGDYRAEWVGFGQLSFYLLAVVAFSWYVRDRLGVHAWRLIHMLSFALFLMVLIHGLQSGTDSGSIWALTLPLIGQKLGRYVFSNATRDGSRKFWGQVFVKHPERVDDLVLDYDVANMRRNVESMLGLVSRMASARRLGYRRELVLGERWRDLTTPTLLIWGEFDAFGSPEEGQALVAKNPNLRLVRIAGAGHNLWFDDPESVVAEIERFLATQPRSGVEAVA